MNFIRSETSHNPVAVPDVSIVMPCLNEVQSLPHCILNAQEALAHIALRFGLQGEIVIADNGSTDGSQALAETLGARVAPVLAKGYGAALIGGCHAAQGRFILMGDCDGSYDFIDGAAMIGELLDGKAMCIGSRFAGGIAPGAMPWKNRYIGNPALTGILNLFFRAGISDAHCGLRAIRKESFQRLKLCGTGMEFASEMVIKASLLRLPMSEVPATLSPDLRDRAPHLRPWRDGWRHLRYLLMLAPNWLFGVPALLALILGVVIMGMSAMGYVVPGSFPYIGDYWTIIGAALCTVGHLSLIMTGAGQLYALRSGYRRPGGTTQALASFITLEKVLMLGLSAILLGGTVLIYTYVKWVGRNYGMADNIFPPVLGTLGVTLGIQTMLGGFLLAILGGNEAAFLKASSEPDQAGEGLNGFASTSALSVR